eukprot:m.57703 g.57703  ORF g.57703 m.57703 type:complete len:127 (-) comp7097_c0_seq1:130-510(-)
MEREKRKRDDDSEATGRVVSRTSAAAAIAAEEERRSKPTSKADKRAHHNALERKRRDHIKDSFTVLRDSIPALTGEKQASRAQILNKATDYIEFMRKKNAAHAAEMEELRKQNEQLAVQSQGARGL